MLTVFLLTVACTGDIDSDTDVDTDSAVEDDTEVDTDAPYPLTLSETGLFSDIETGVLADDVLSYDVAWPLWTDGATKDRYLSLPEGTVIDTSDPDYWVFPVGTRSWKTFSRDGVRVETRFMELTDDEEAPWIWVSYAWREDGSDADAVPFGVEDAAGTDHDIPDTAACFRCHTGLGFLGIGAIQQGDDNPDGTLDAWTEAGLLSDPITESTAVPGEGVTREVLGYLHGNCGGCHVDPYYWSQYYDLRLRMRVGTMSPEDSTLYQTAIDQPTVHQVTTVVAVAPGDPESSQLLERMTTRGLTQMPPLGTETVHTEAVDHVTAWIEALPTTTAE